MIPDNTVAFASVWIDTKHTCAAQPRFAVDGHAAGLALADLQELERDLGGRARAVCVSRNRLGVGLDAFLQASPVDPMCNASVLVVTCTLRRGALPLGAYNHQSSDYGMGFSTWEVEVVVVEPTTVKRLCFVQLRQQADKAEQELLGPTVC